MSLFRLLYQGYKFSQNKQVRLLKALLITSITFIVLIFFIDSLGLDQHLDLTKASLDPRFHWISSILATFLGLDPLKDVTKLTLISILLGSLTFVTFLAFFSGVFYVIGFSFLGGQVGRIGLNFHQGKDVLLSYPGSKEPFIQRKGTSEEKIEISEKMIDHLSQQYQCPKSIMDSQSLLQEMQTLHSRESIEQLTREQFQIHYEKYMETLNQTPTPKTTSTATETFNVLCQFCSEHSMLVAVVTAVVLAAIIWTVTRTPPSLPPTSPTEVAESAQLEIKNLKERLDTTEAELQTLAEKTSTLLKKVENVEERLSGVRQEVKSVANGLHNYSAGIRALIAKVSAVETEMLAFDEWKDYLSDGIKKNLPKSR